MPRRVVGRERTAVTDVGTRYKTIAQNRRARFNYDIGEQFEAGIVLSGTEIKSVREGRVNIAEAYARVRAGELWRQLVGHDQEDVWALGSAVWGVGCGGHTARPSREPPRN